MCEVKQSREPWWLRLLYSPLLEGRSAAHKVAYAAVMTALCIAVNLFEFKFADVQFSLTVFSSVLAGILIGPVCGFGAAFLGDLLGYLVNSMGFLYFWWVALSCAVMALLSGLIMMIPLSFRGSGYVKLALICLATLLVCSVGINTTGFYFFYSDPNVGFTSRALELMRETFGENTYWAYAAVRLLFMGQLWNNLFNYALLFVVLPILGAIKPLKLHFA